MRRRDGGTFQAGDTRETVGVGPRIAKAYTLTIRNGAGQIREDTLVALNFHDFMDNLDYAALSADDVITSVTLAA